MTAIEKLQMLIEAAEYLDRREREAEHGYASMLPFTSNKERDGLKRKIKSKKNCSSRMRCYSESDWSDKEMASVKRAFIHMVCEDSTPHHRLVYTQRDGEEQRLEDSERKAQHSVDQLQREQRHLRRRLEQLGVERTRMDSMGSTISSDKSDSDQEEVDVDVEGTDYLLGDLEWSTSSVSDSDERGSLRSSCSDEGYSSASLRRLANPQEKSPALGCSL
ncbi:Max dimerization protein 1 [Anabarilius grahami]|uniref:Max dimerization protein 1 n=1 Tax=Anabarilius grahami TaxID=495550 RepID=A0A3N0YTN7_ANAGA|nr:Max dimerization protein 1 [Anabarilius grahami]